VNFPWGGMLSRQIKGKRDTIPLHSTCLVNFPWGGMLSRQTKSKRDAIPLHSTCLVNFPWGGMLSRQIEGKRDAIPLHSTYLVNFPWGGMLSRQTKSKRDAIPLHSTEDRNFPWGGMLSRGAGCYPAKPRVSGMPSRSTALKTVSATCERLSGCKKARAESRFAAASNQRISRSATVRTRPCPPMPAR